MKLLPILVFLSLAATVRADDSATSCQIGWPEGYFAQDKVPPKMEAYEAGLDMSFVYWGEKAADLKLQEIDEDFLSRLTASPFAILGRYQCSKIAPGSTLEMLCHFTPEKPGDPELVYASRTPIVAETGSSDRWQTFLLPFDATGAKTHLVKIELKLHLAGGYGSSMGFDQVYLRQYPDGKFPNTASSSGTAHLQGDTLAATLPSPIPSLQPAFQVVAPAPPPIASDAPTLQVIADLPIEKYLSSAQDQDDLLANFSQPGESKDQAQVSVIKESGGISELLVIRTENSGRCRTALLTIPQDVVSRITGMRYGIVGEVSYSGISRGALCMGSCFSRVGLSAPSDIWMSDQQGPVWGAHDDSMGLMVGTREWGNFYLGFDRKVAAQQQHSTLILKRIMFNIVLDNPGTVHLRNLKLVQYPDASAPSLPQTTTSMSDTTTPATSSSVLPTSAGKELIVSITQEGDTTHFWLDGIEYDEDHWDLAINRRARMDHQLAIVMCVDANVPARIVDRQLKFCRETDARNVSLAQVGATASTSSSSINAEKSRSAFDLESFLLGVASTGVSILAGGGIIFISRRWNRRRHERELRRIASLDS